MRPRTLPIIFALTAGCASGVVVIAPVATITRVPYAAHPTFCSGMDPSDSTVHDTMEVKQRPVLYQTRRLRYPSSAWVRGIQGRVVLVVTINADGRPDAQSVQPVSSPDSELTAEAIRWVRAAHFVPACLADKAVRVRIAIPVDFRFGN
jgi:TonB family protein